MFNKPKIDIAMRKAQHVAEIEFVFNDAGSTIAMGVQNCYSSRVLSDDELKDLIIELNEAIKPVKDSWVKRYIKEMHDDLVEAETKCCGNPISD